MAHSKGLPNVSVTTKSAGVALRHVGPLHLGLSPMSPAKFVRLDLLVQRLEHVADVLGVDVDMMEWLSHTLAPEVYGEAKAASEPCKAPPGSPAKLLALKKRWARKLSLWHPDDAGFGD